MMHALKKCQRGFTLLETAIVMGIMGMVTFGASMAAFEAQKKQQERFVAEQMRLLYEDVSSYVDQNLPILLKETALSVPGNVHYIDLNLLVEEGYLPPSFEPTNLQGQGYKIALRRMGPNRTPLRLELLMLTHGTPFKDRNGRRAAFFLGPRGGFVYDKFQARNADGQIFTPGQYAVGPAASWSVPLRDFSLPASPGQLAMYRYYNFGDVRDF